MAAAQQRHQQQVDRGRLAYNHTRNIFAHLGGEALDIFDGSRHAHTPSLVLDGTCGTINGATAQRIPRIAQHPHDCGTYPQALEIGIVVGGIICVSLLLDKRIVGNVGLVSREIQILIACA